jgi:hypothetical protein
MLSGVFRLSGFDTAAHDWLFRWVKASTAHSEQIVSVVPQWPDEMLRRGRFSAWGPMLSEKIFGGSLRNIDSK